MEKITQAIHDLYAKILKKDQDQTRLDNELSEKEASLSSRERALENSVKGMAKREAACAVIEDISATQKANATEKQKLSEERNLLEEAKKAHAEFVAKQNLEMANDRKKIQAEFVAIKATKDAMEEEVTRRVQALIGKIKKT